MIDLYYWPTPNGWKVSIALEELGLPYDVKYVDIGAGDQFKPDFLAISPNNRMPAIVDRNPTDGGDPISVFESGAILLYLADKTGALDALVRATEPLVVGFLNLPPRTAVAFIMGFLRRDYGAAGLHQLYEEGLLDPTQVIVSMVVITLFVPCIANFFVIIKEHGLRKALAMTAFIFPFAILVGGAVNFILRALGYGG